MVQKPVIGIVGGNGQMGGLFRKLLESKGFNVLISSDKTALSPKQMAKQSDIVIISIPINKTIQVIREIAPLLKEGGCIADLTSIKKEPIKEMCSFSGKKVEVVGMHPLFGPCIESFNSQTVVLCPGRGHYWIKWFRKIFRQSKMSVKIIEAQEHDELMAIVQALRHFSLISYAKALKDSKIPLKQLIEYSTPQNYLKMAQVSGILRQNPELFADIELLNPSAKKILNKYFESVKKLKKIVDKNDRKAFIKFFEESKGFFAELKDEKIETVKEKGRKKLKKR